MKFTLKIYDENFEKYYSIQEILSMDEFYLKNQDDEGGTFPTKNLFELLDKYFKEKF